MVKLVTGMVLEVGAGWEVLTIGDRGYVSRGVDQPLKGDGMPPPVVVFHPLWPAGHIPVYNCGLEEGIEEGRLRIVPGATKEQVIEYGDARRQKLYDLQDKYNIFDQGFDLRTSEGRNRLDELTLCIARELSGLTPERVWIWFTNQEKDNNPIAREAVVRSYQRHEKAGRILPLGDCKQIIPC